MAKIEFKWSHDGKREDGSEVSGLFFRLYENDALAVDNIGELHFSLLMDGRPKGTYRYSVTAVDSNLLESPKSNAVSVGFFAPSAPTGLSASFSA